MTSKDKQPKCPECGADGYKVGGHVPNCYECCVCVYRFEVTYYQCPNCPDHMEERDEGILYCSNCDMTAFQGAQFRKDKLVNILMGLLITWVEDQFVRPEHREPRAARPECSFEEQCWLMYQTEALNCHIILDDEDKDHFINNLIRVCEKVRT